MFITKTNISKKRVLAIASALIIASTSLHTYTVTTQQVQPTQSTQAVPVKTPKPTHATQSTKSIPTQPNTTAHTILKAGYNTGKVLGIGLAGIFLRDNLRDLKNINKQNIWIATSMLTTIPALAESVYASYKKNENKQESQHNTTTKTIVKAIYNVGKASSITLYVLFLSEILKTDSLNENPFLCSLCAFLSTTTIAALGESIYNDYKQLEPKNNTAAPANKYTTKTQ